RGQSLAEQVQGIGLGARVDPKQPRVDAPSEPAERTPQVHRRAVARQKPRNDEDRRPVLRAARLKGTEAGQQAGEVPGKFAHPPPCRRGDVVGLNRSGFSDPSPFHGERTFLPCPKRQLSAAEVVPPAEGGSSLAGQLRV